MKSILRHGTADPAVWLQAHASHDTTGSGQCARPRVNAVLLISMLLGAAGVKIVQVAHALHRLLPAELIEL